MGMADDKHFDDELVNWALKGDAEAYDFCRRLMTAMHVWDDVHDDDVPLEKERVDLGLFDLIANIPYHPFLKRYPSLHSVMVASALMWMTANRLEERKTRRALEVSYTLRACYLQVLHYSAYLVGGTAWAAQAGERIWGDQPLEDMNEYMEEHGVKRG